MKLSLSIIKNGINALSSFIKETRAETKKVVWPSKQYVIAATIIILLIVFIAGFYIIFLDSMFAKLFARLMGLR